MNNNFMEKEQQEEELRKHVRNLPCFSCLVRPACIEFFVDGNAYVDTKKMCVKFDKWGEERDGMLSFSPKRSKIIMEEILEILRKEKECWETIK